MYVLEQSHILFECPIKTNNKNTIFAFRRKLKSEKINLTSEVLWTEFDLLRESFEKHTCLMLKNKPGNYWKFLKLQFNFIALIVCFTFWVDSSANKSQNCDQNRPKIVSKSRKKFREKNVWNWNDTFLRGFNEIHRVSISSAFYKQLLCAPAPGIGDLSAGTFLKLLNIQILPWISLQFLILVIKTTFWTKISAAPIFF